MDQFLLRRKVEYCGLRGSMHLLHFSGGFFINSQFAPELCVLGGKVAGLLPQRFILGLKALIFIFNFCQQFFQVIHSFFFTVARSLGSDSVLQFSSKHSFIGCEVGQPLPFLGFTIQTQPFCHSRGEVGGNQWPVRHHRTTRQRGDHNGLGRYHCHLDSFLEVLLWYQKCHQRLTK